MAVITRRVSVVVGCIAWCLAVLSSTGCDNPKISGGVATVFIKDKPFYLEVAATDEVRIKGMGGRTSIEPDGGMVFVFRSAEKRHFVMRDCVIPIDIMFLDGAGKVLATYTMPVEAPRGADEPVTADPMLDKYEQRLPRYSSRFPSQFVIELKAGTIGELGIREGDQVRMDTEGLKRLAE